MYRKPDANSVPNEPSKLQNARMEAAKASAQTVPTMFTILGKRFSLHASLYLRLGLLR